MQTQCFLYNSTSKKSSQVNSVGLRDSVMSATNTIHSPYWTLVLHKWGSLFAWDAPLLSNYYSASVSGFNYQPDVYYIYLSQVLSICIYSNPLSNNSSNQIIFLSSDKTKNPFSTKPKTYHDKRIHILQDGYHPDHTDHCKPIPGSISHHNPKSPQTSKNTPTLRPRHPNPR